MAGSDSNSSKPNGHERPDPDSGADPSMEDILASIRRILIEDEASQPASVIPVPGHAAATHVGLPEDAILVLDASMLVPEEQPAQEPIMPEPTPPLSAPDDQAAHRPKPNGPEGADGGSASLVSPAAATAAANSVGNLVRTLAAERHAAVHRAGPTIEDLVREEIRPLLKEWLDNNLPPVVERAVRIEIERVIGRAVP